MSKQKCVVFDIDGTLADMTHREHYVADGNKNWKRFYEQMFADKPVEHVMELLDFYRSKGHKIVVLTGREGTESNMKMTVDWLATHAIFPDVGDFKMRGEKDYRPDYEVKSEMMESVASKYDVHCIFDDRPSVVRMWRDKGFFTFCVNQRNKEF